MRRVHAAGGARIRVIEVNPSRQVWGAEMATLAMLQPLARLGIELVLASPPGGELAERWIGLGAEHIPLVLPSRRGLRSAEDRDRRAGLSQLATELGASVSAVRRVAAVARTGDVVHTSSLWAHLDCALGARLARRPVVLELCDLVRPGLGRHVLTGAMGLATAATAVSRAAAQCVGPFGSRRLQILPPAVDIEHFAPGPRDLTIRQALGVLPDVPLVGIIGRIDPDKGVDVVVRAVALLPSSLGRVQLVVVGGPGLDSGGYLDSVRSEAEQLLGDRVRFTGRMDDVAAVVRSLDVLVNASAAEPFGLTVLEAQASGVPVVATCAGGIPDFVVDGETGLLVESGDAKALADALNRVLGDGRLRDRLGRAGRAAAVAHYSSNDRAEVLANIYRGVLGEAKLRRGSRGDEP